VVEPRGRKGGHRAPRRRYGGPRALRHRPGRGSGACRADPHPRADDHGRPVAIPRGHRVGMGLRMCRVGSRGPPPSCAATTT
jgi:hypothetical protein